MKTFSIGSRAERLVSLNCNLCGCNKTKLYLNCKIFKYVRCRSCGLVFQDPQPIFEDLKERYKNEYFIYELENDKNFFNLMKLGLKDVKFFDKPFSDFSNKRFLDIGCATGLLVKYMQNKGWESSGIEICKESAEYGIKNRGVKIVIKTLGDANFDDEHFSVIHFSHVIEHIPSPLTFLKEVFRVLAPGGKAIITTPNVKGFQAKIFGAEWRSAIADHLTLFSKKTLRTMLKKAGFKLEKMVTWGGLAKGTVPGFIKKPVDKLAKRFGFGDVVLFQVTK